MFPSRAFRLRDMHKLGYARPPLSVFVCGLLGVGRRQQLNAHASLVGHPKSSQRRALRAQRDERCAACSLTLTRSPNCEWNPARHSASSKPRSASSCRMQMLLTTSGVGHHAPLSAHQRKNVELLYPPAGASSPTRALQAAGCPDSELPDSQEPRNTC